MIPTNALLPFPAARRHHLSNLGCHLHRSVLRVALGIDALRDVLRGLGLPSAGSAAALLDMAAGLAAQAGAEADALHVALDREHAAAIHAFDAARDTADLLTAWLQAAGGSDMPGAYWALMTHPLADRSLRHTAFGDAELLAGTPTPRGPLAELLERRSVSPRRLAGPAPAPEHLDLMLQAALAAPDHGRLRPWRVIEFRPDTRARLAEIFEAEKRRRDPVASALDLKRAREHATRPPCLLAFVVSPQQRKRIPVREQWLSAGAALGNLLNAAHAMGYGAIVLSGDRCFDLQVAVGLGLAPEEFIAGFVSIGTTTEAPPEPARPLSQTVWSCWTGIPPRYDCAIPLMNSEPKDAR